MGLHAAVINRYAIIKHGIVENICLWDGNPQNWEPPAGFDLKKLGEEWCEIGASYDGSRFAPAPAKSSSPTLEERVAALERKLSGAP